MTVYILIGLPGSGKSYWAKRKVVNVPRTVIINRDALYTMLAGEYRYNETLSEMVQALFVLMIREGLSLGFDLIIDETHTTKERRQCTYNLVTKFGYGLKIVYVHFTETERNLEYRMRDSRGQERGKWQSVIEDMKRHFEPFDGEDYDELIKVDEDYF